MVFPKTPDVPEIDFTMNVKLRTLCKCDDMVTSLIPEPVSNFTVAELPANDAGKCWTNSSSRNYIL